MEWMLANWELFAPIVVPIALWFLKRYAKKSKNVWDDKLVTLLAGIWDISRKRTPRNTTGKAKVKKYSHGGDTPED